LGVLLGADDVGIEVGRLGEITDMNDLIAVAGGDGGAALAAARGEEGARIPSATVAVAARRKEG
jgi:hypothetical protein